MYRSVSVLLCTVVVCVFAGVAAAADPSPENVTITMTATSILEGDPVEFVFRNDSDFTVYGYSDPAFVIRSLTTDEYVFAGMLPVCPPFEPAVDHPMAWDQTGPSGGTVAWGNYRVELRWCCEDCAVFVEGTATADFEITEMIETVPSTWGDIRRLLR